MSEVLGVRWWDGLRLPVRLAMNTADFYINIGLFYCIEALALRVLAAGLAANVLLRIGLTIYMRRDL